MDRRAPLVAALVTAASPVGAQDSAGLQAATRAYLDQALAAAQAQAGEASGEGDMAFVALLARDERWVNPNIKPRIGPTLTHFGLYGAQSVQVTGTRMAGDAARVSVSVSYEQVPGIGWPARVDFLRVDGTWKIRDIGLDRRRALPVNADPNEVLAAYVGGMRSAVARRATLAPRSWIGQTLESHWTLGGGGYWRQPQDCSADIRADCHGAGAGGAHLWAALALDREKTVEISDVRSGGSGPVAEVTVTITRRTMTETRVFEITLERDKRHGWQIASLTPVRDAAGVGDVHVAANDTDGLSLVTSLIDALTGPEAPAPAALIGNLDAIAPYFADSRDGRKAMAQMVNLNLMLTAMGARLDSRRISAESDGRVRATFEADRGRVPDLLFYIEAAGGGPKISGVVRE